MIKNKLETIAYGQLQPTGWLADQMRLQMDGITGNLDENWGCVSRFSDWLGGTDNGWERPPYWLDGLVPLAYLLKDGKGMEKAAMWMDWSLRSQRENGDFGPIYRTDGFEESLFWPKYVMLKAFVSYYEATGREEILTFMTKYMKFCNGLMDTFQLSGWNEARAGDFVYTIFWLYEKTGEEFLLELAHKVNEKALNWTDFMENLPFVRPTGVYYNFSKIFRETTRSSLYDVMAFHKTHIVNVVMAVKQPLMMYRETGDRRYLEAVYKGIESLTRCHGQVTGVFSGDEHLSGLAPTQGTELCSVVEYMFSLQLLLEATGDALFADLLERVAYNALPATITEDFRGHQYDQQVNQVLVSLDQRDWYNNDPDSNLFGFEPNFGCCLANMHQGWPKFIKNALLTDSRNHTLWAAVYMPMTARVTMGNQEIQVQEETLYPVDGQVKFTFRCPEPAEFTFKMRIPGWCKAYTIAVNGEKTDCAVEAGYGAITRTFRDQDVITLTMEMDVVVNRKPWYHNGATVERGPLLFALKIQEEWKALGYSIPAYPDYEVRPGSPWNYALDLTEKFTVELDVGKLGKQLFSYDHCPVCIHTRGFLLPHWQLEHNSAGDLPVSPVEENLLGQKQDITLIPYGATALRISLFPWI